MRIVLDTNVLVSGIFFGGLPRKLLEAWAEGRVELVLSPQIFDEYLRTCDRLGARHPGLEYRQTLAALVGHATLAPDVEHPEAITDDPDDDKFMACAHHAGAVVVSGDRHLLEAAGWNGVEVLRPRDLVDRLGE